MTTIEEIIDDLINAQPHIAECANASFIDDHVNLAITKLRALSNPIVLDKNGTYWDRGFPNELIDHTIERCAKEAEKFIESKGIAAAIRALRDKPHEPA